METPVPAPGYSEEPWYPTGEPVPNPGSSEEPWYEPTYEKDEAQALLTEVARILSSHGYEDDAEAVKRLAKQRGCICGGASARALRELEDVVQSYEGPSCSQRARKPRIGSIPY
jgi:hypothetical protein